MRRAIEVVRVLAHARASRPIIYFDVLFVCGIGIVNAGRLSVRFFEVLCRLFIDGLLRFVDFVIHAEGHHFVALRFRVRVVSRCAFVPLSDFLDLFVFSDCSVSEGLSNGAHDASGRPFVMFFRFRAIDAQARVRPFHPYL